MTIKKYLKETFRLGFLRKPIICKDGFSMSVQASSSHYCTPRRNLFNGDYETVEIGFPSEKEDLLIDYAEIEEELTKTVYGYVPVEVVEEIIKKHGGIKYELR